MSRRDGKLRLRVIHTVDKQHLFEGCRHVLCCLSGGVDSSVMLHVLLSLRTRYGFEVSAVHVNHSIRGDEADRDELFCKKLCEKLGVPFISVRVNVPEYAVKNSISTELAARTLRYDAFERVMNDIGADVAATAHNADDNAETLLFNIIRGTSPAGICAIPYKRGRYVRPLLAVTREMIIDYAAVSGIGYVTDSTNCADDYTRNYIRHNIIPLCVKLNPSFLSAVNRLTDGAKEDEQLIKSSGVDKRRGIVDFLNKNGISGVNHDVICKLSDALSAGGSRVFTLTDGKKVTVENGQLKLAQAGEALCVYDGKKLQMGDNSFFDGIVEIKLEASQENFKAIYKSFTTVGFVSDIILRDVTVRNRMSGDCITVAGVRKSVKKELINKKIPKSVRNILPVICIDGKIAFVPYVGVDDGFSPHTEESIKISVIIKF